MEGGAVKYEIRKAKPDDVRPALELALRVFTEFIPLNRAQKTAERFRERIENAEYIENYQSGRRLMFIAVENEKIIGMINERDESHITKLFVDGNCQRQGVATKLTERMVCGLKLRGINRITVNSSPYGLPFYENFGFRADGDEREKDGIIYTPMVYEPKEIWDILDADGNKTGRYAERGRKIAPDDYFLVVHVWKHNSRDEWLIDRRSFTRGTEIDGKWETTGGAAISGDDSLSAALREAKEELGIELAPDSGKMFCRITNKNGNWGGCITDVWVFETDLPVETVQLQEEEACEAMWASTGKIREMMAAGEFLGKKYYPYFDEMTEKYKI